MKIRAGEKDTLVRQIQCGSPGSTQAQRKCRLQRAMLSFSLALVSLLFFLSHLCLAGGQKGREMAFGGINRGGEDWKKLTMEINKNGGSKYFSIWTPTDGLKGFWRSQMGPVTFYWILLSIKDSCKCTCTLEKYIFYSQRMFISSAF